MPIECRYLFAEFPSNKSLKNCFTIKIVVIWVGTNNHENTSEEIVEALEAIVWKVTSSICKSVVLVS